MADNAEDLVVTAHLRDELTATSRRVRGELRSIGRDVDEVNVKNRAAAAGAATHTRHLDNLAGVGKKVDGSLRTLSGTLSGALARGLKVAAVGVVALLAATAGFGVKASSNFQQTQIALEGLLESADAGRKMFADLQAFNQKTPFELGDLSSASRVLLGFGIAGDQVLPIIKSVADAASGLGGGAETMQRIILNLGQIQSQGKVTGRELRDLAQVGFPGYQLMADALGMTREQVRALGDDVEVSADQFIRAVTAGEGPLARFAGMAEKQAHSLAGLWSNIKDAATQGAVTATQPIVAALEPILGKGGPLERFIGTFLAGIGPPLASLAGTLLNGLMAILPAVTPILAALTGGIAQLLGAAGPGFAALQPVAGAIADSIGRLVAELVPVMPDLVDAFVALVGVAPAFVDLLTAMVPLVGPTARLLTALLGLGPVRDLLAGLLIVLLGYRALSSIAGAVSTFSGSLRGLAAAETEEAAARTAGAGAGLPAGAGLAVGLGAAAIPLFADAAKHKGTTRGKLSFLGGMTATGAAAGSVVPGVGTLVGAGVGLTAGGIALGLGELFGDTPGRRRLQSTWAAHAAIDGAVPGRRAVTNATFGRGDSDHRAGAALDIVGSGLFAYANAVRGAGGYADWHGSHLHAVYGDTPSPRRGSGRPSDAPSALVHVAAGGALVHVDTVAADVDLEAAVAAGIRRYDRERHERGSVGRVPD